MEKYKGVLSLIQGLKYNILYINNSFFYIFEWNPADEHNHFHQLTGIECTKVLDKNVNMVLQDISVLNSLQADFQKLLTTENKASYKFSKDYSYILFY